MAFTELYADASAGSNLNGGAPIGGAYPVTSTNGAYTQGGGAGGTDRFAAAAGTPFSGCAAGDFVSVYNDGAAAPTPFVGRVTAVNGGGASLDISLTAISGTRPATAANGKTATVGGPWKGCNGTDNFPFNFLANTLTNSAGDFPRCNFKNNATYSITAAVTHSLAGPVRFEGYTTTAGDGGRATIDGGTTNANLLTLSGANCVLACLIVQNNATGSVRGITVSGNENLLVSCVANSVRNDGFRISGTNCVLIECEAYSCNAANAATNGGFVLVTGGTITLIRCISHDNSGSNSNGFITQVPATFIHCIADTNGADGFNSSNNAGCQFRQCDSYNNTGDGLDIANTAAALYVVENCNFVKNGGWGINGSGAGTRNGSVVNCGFGSGSQANSSGTTTGLSAMIEIGSITYASGVTPWVAPATGDFSINLAAAIAAGRGTFTETQASYTGTVGYPDVGAAQSKGGGGPQTCLVYGESGFID